MANVYDIDLKQLASKLQKSKEYSIYVLYRDVPINVKTKLLWIDITKANDIYIAFDWKNVSLKYAFRVSKEAYVKISIPYNNRELSFYLHCDIFSAIGNELVLMVKSLLEAPPFLKRAGVRVEVDDKISAFADICINDTKECFNNMRIKNVSENGFAIAVKKEEDGGYVKFLEEVETYINKDLTFEVKLRINYDEINAVANLINIYDEENAVIAGFKMNVDKKDRQKLSSFIMKRQQEIIQEIKAL